MIDRENMTNSLIRASANAEQEEVPLEEQVQQEQATQQKHGEHSEQIVQEEQINVVFKCNKCKREIGRLIKRQDINNAKKYKNIHKEFESIECDGEIKIFQIKEKESAIGTA